MANVKGIRNDWSDNFSANAADLIRLQLAFAGPKVGQAIMLRCFKRRPTSGKINERTVIAVLQELSDDHAEVL